MNYQPFTFHGFKIFVEPDRPKMQLSELVKEVLSPEVIEETNAWMVRFFGYQEHWLRDGEYIVSEFTSAIHMNPRTYDQFKAAVPRVKFREVEAAPA